MSDVIPAILKWHRSLQCAGAWTIPAKLCTTLFSILQWTKILAGPDDNATDPPTPVLDHTALITAVLPQL